MIILNGHEISWGDAKKGGTYGSGEIMAKIPKYLGVYNEILYRWAPQDNGMEVLMAIRKTARDLFPHAKNVLVLEYVPNARQDKPIKDDYRDGYMLAPMSQYYAEFINWLDFDVVIGIEPHSNKFFMYYKNAKAEYPTMKALEMIGRITGYKQNYQVIFPDQGSYERYKNEITIKICYADYVIMKKKRVNGKIEELDVAEGELSKTKKKIIIDDICGTGSTILKTAKCINNLLGEPQDIKVLVAFLEDTVQNNDENEDEWVLSDKSPISQIIVCGPPVFAEIPNEKVVYLHYSYAKKDRISFETIASLF